MLWPTWKQLAAWLLLPPLWCGRRRWRNRLKELEERVEGWVGLKRKHLERIRQLEKELLEKKSAAPPRARALAVGARPMVASRMLSW